MCIRDSWKVVRATAAPNNTHATVITPNDWPLLITKIIMEISPMIVKLEQHFNTPILSFNTSAKIFQIAEETIAIDAKDAAFTKSYP